MSRTNIKIKKLDLDYFDKVHEFILANYAKLENKDFFIINDIQTALPIVFSDKGVIIGALNINDEVIGIQAVDYSDDTCRSLMAVLSDDLSNSKYVEMGWTMTDMSYQNQGIAKTLISSLEDVFVAQEEVVFVATIHPNNYKSLKTYLHLGYVGVTMQLHFGLPRIFLIKKNDYIICCKEDKAIKLDDSNRLSNLLNKGYVLIDVIDNDDAMSYVLSKV